MASDSDQSDPRSGSRGGRYRKGKGPVIDLTATEVSAPTTVPDEAAAAPETSGTAADADNLFVAETSEGPASVGSESNAQPEGVQTDAARQETAAAPAVTEAEKSPETRADRAGEAEPIGPAPADGVEPEGAAASPAGEAGAPSEPSSLEEGTPEPARADTLDPGETGTAAAGEPEPARVETPEPIPLPPPEPRKGGAIGSLAAAALGGVIVLAGGALLFASGVIEAPAPAQTAATPESVAAVEARVGAVEAKVADLAGGPAPAADAALADRVTALEQAETAPPSSQPDPAVAELRQQVEALTQRLDQSPTTAGGEASPQLGALADAVETLRTGAEETRAAIQRLDSAQPAVDPARVAALETGMDELTRRVEALDGGLKQLQTTIEGTLAELGQSAKANGDAATALGERVGTIEKRLDAGPKGGEIAALSLAVTTLATKVARGEPFAADLAIVRTAAPDVGEVGALDAVAATGVPTAETLNRTLPADAILGARPAGPETGVVDRFLIGAKSLVNYRETGEGATDAADKAVADARAALARGDLPAAKAAIDGLPGWGKAAAADWITDLDRSLAADAAVRALTERILVRLQAPAEGQ